MKRRRIGQAGWTPRERVFLWFAIAVNDNWVPDADEMLRSLRRVIQDQDCQPDPITPEWRLPTS